MLNILLILLHIAVALFLIAVVLLQTGKRADLAGAFGGGGSQTAFGTRGAATALTKMTTAAAVMFMLTSIALSIVSSRSRDSTDSVLEQVPSPAQTAPADPFGLPGTDDGSDLPTTLPPVDPGTSDESPEPTTEPTDETPTPADGN
jgi:preprotein translocase subunit SecG